MSNQAADLAELAAMRLAIDLAARQRPHPNPRVGAVVLDDRGTIVGQGAHAGPGTGHAERIALDQAGARAQAGTVVVTLEPCSHYGRTPPCADALIKAGVRRVVVAITDPDQRVSGTGLARLQAAGIDLVTGVMEPEVLDLDPGYLIHRRLGRPRVVVVSVATLDGQTSALDGRPATDLLSESASLEMLELRAQADVVMVTSGFARSAHPKLGAGRDRWPRVALICGRRSPSVDSTMFAFAPIIIAARQFPGGADRGDNGWVVLPTDDGQAVDLDAALHHLGGLGLLDVHLEGGRALVSAFERLGLVDEYRLYLAAGLSGGSGRSVFDGFLATMGDAMPIEIVDAHRVGADLAIHARVQEK